MSECRPHAARLHAQANWIDSGSWCAGHLDPDPYIQVRFNSQSIITGIALQGRPNQNDPSHPWHNCCEQRVRSYRFWYSADCETFLSYTDGNGNSTIQCVQKCIEAKAADLCRLSGFDKATGTCYLSLNHADDVVSVTDDNKLVLIPGDAYICSRGDYLVSGRKPLPDDQITASSTLNYPAASVCTTVARLHAEANSMNVGSWCADYQDPDPYIQVQVRFSNQSIITGIALQGRPIHTDPTNIWYSFNWIIQFVTSYRFWYSEDCVTFLPYTDDNGTATVFPGNSDRDNVVTNMLPRHVTAMCVRINPVTWEGYCSLRFDIFGCVKDTL
ncbi:lactadherin-like [Mya arenaria]|uniref:lactadherin-like n=1 Tax=Mya arenaria TaxID=6604 RepID=UPI0022E853BA|nr:lactadherin-like [Mya arenaria]